MILHIVAMDSTPLSIFISHTYNGAKISFYKSTAKKFEMLFFEASRAVRDGD
jgi:hypothetical protein